MSIAAGAAVAIFVKPHHGQAARLADELAAWLAARGLKPRLDPPDDGDRLAMAAILGGDGTMLHVAPRLARDEVPVLAVHLGTLGFLTETARDQLYPSLEVILAGGGHRERRALARAELERDGKVIARFDALNEIVAAKSGLARMVQMDLSVDGERVAAYRADGVLVATPTGSTAYSFSAGGPVLHPRVEALLVTPICPHGLGLRPLVVPASARICIEVRGATEDPLLTVDGQHGERLRVGDRIHCTRSPLSLTLLSANGPGFFPSLRAKLHWG
jgi:NAD+ kinase